MARLTITQENSARNVLDLEPGSSIRVGRGAENEVVLDDPRSSRVHAIISQTDGEWVVTDMDSRNGTRLNGKPIHEASLRDGDRIQIGGAVLEFGTAAHGGAKPQRKPASRAEHALRSGETFSDDDFRPAANFEPETARATTKPMSRSIVLGIVLVAVLGLGLVLVSQPRKEPQAPIPLPARDAVGQLPNGDTSHASAAVFVYTPPSPLPKALELHYKAFDIDTDDEVKVYLNGQPILAVPPTGDGVWSSTRTHEIALDQLKPGDQNFLVFQHAYNKEGEPAAYAWGVSDIEFAAVVELPCNATEAEEHYRLANKLFDDRRVQTSNLYHSIQKLERAFALTKNCIPKPIFYTEVTSRLHEARRELDEAYKYYDVEFTKSRKLGRIQECLQIITRIQQLIPDREDPRYIQALRWKRALPVPADQKSGDNLF